MRLLLIEDEIRLSGALTYIFKKGGYLVDTATNGQQGLDIASTGIHDIIILDWMLPDVDGMTILKGIRQLGINAPVILLTAKDTSEDKVLGLDAGADDYLVKPFSTEDLLARIHSLSRRREKELASEKLTFGNLTLDPLLCQVSIDEKIVELSVEESSLLELLIKNPGIVLSKERILEKVWGHDTSLDTPNVNLYIHYLRKKLNTNLIKTIRGVGYYLDKE